MDPSLNARSNLGLYYEPSGKVPMAGVVLMLFLGAIGGALLGAIYGYLTQYNPFIYISFVATFGLGFGLGMAGWFAGHIGKVRAPQIAASLGAVVGMMGLYLSWVVWLHALAGRSDQDRWLFDPADVWKMISTLATEGIWSLFSWTPTGPFLYFVWLIEAAIIVGIPALVCYEGARRTPYCEACDDWAIEEYSGLKLASIADPGVTRRRLESGEVAGLIASMQKSPDAHTLVTLETCRKCHQVGFLSVEAVRVTPGPKGKTTETKCEVVRHLILGPPGIEVARRLTELAPLTSPQESS